jgi:ribosomal protein S18 acetylase RimI-like enzyme
MPTDTRLLIREYRAGDHDTVVALNAYGLAAAGVPAAADAYAGDLDEIATWYLAGRAAMLVGELAGAVVAMGAVRPLDDTTCEITRMRVAPAVQGRGYGKAVLDALEQRARQLGYLSAVLLTGPDQHPAIDLYRAAGYTITTTERHGPIVGVRMRKALGRTLRSSAARGTH